MPARPNQAPRLDTLPPRADLHPADPQQRAQDLRTRVPRQDREALAAWARRIHENDGQVRAMPYHRRIAVLAEVTGAKKADLRQQPALRDTDPQMAQLADPIRTRTPRQDREALTAWARRIHESDEEVRAMPYHRRIAVLADVTGARAGDLRREPALRDTDPQTAQLADTIRTRVPRQDHEPLTAWARRIHESDEQVRAMPYHRRIAVLAVATGAAEGTLRHEPALRDTDPQRP